MATLQPGPIARTPLEHATFESAPHKRTRGPQTLCRTECAMPIQNACKRNTHVAWYRLASLDRHLETAGVLSCKLESQRPPTTGGQGCVASRSHRRSPRSRARAKAARSAREFRTCDSGYPIVTRPKGLCRLRTFVDLLWVVWAGYGLQRPQGWQCTSGRWRSLARPHCFEDKSDRSPWIIMRNIKNEAWATDHHTPYPVT